MTLLAYLANRRRCFSFPHSTAGATQMSCAPEAEADFSPPDKEAKKARREHVERLERDISRRLRAVQPGGSHTEPALPGLAAESPNFDSRSNNGSTGLSSFDDSSASGSTRRGSEDTLEPWNITVLRGSDKPVHADSNRCVHRAITALSHFVQGEEAPSSEGAATSYRRSSTQDSLGSDADEGPEEEPPEEELPKRRGIRRATSMPVEGPRAAAEAQGGQKQAKRLQRSASLDLNSSSTSKGEAEVVRRLKLRAQEAGTRNRTKWRRHTMWNQCFYLSIANAYMGTGDNVRQTKRLARRLRYAIEAAVLEKHPSWSQGLRDSAEGTGPAMVYADFLHIAMQVDGLPKESNFLSRLAVCVLDSAGGHAEVYMGPEYSKLSSREEQEKNFIVLLHVPGHYCCLVRDDDRGSKLGMTYNEFKERLDEKGIFCIETVA